MSDYDYNEYYTEKEYFGAPYEALLKFFEKSNRGTLVDLGAGQGRDSIPISKMGYKVTAVDVSSVGIEQIRHSDETIQTVVDDLYIFDVSDFDYILMDSIMHFEDSDKEKEVSLVKRILRDMKNGAVFVNCIIKGEEGEKVLKEIFSEFDVESIFEDYSEYKLFDETYHFHIIAIKKMLRG